MKSAIEGYVTILLILFCIIITSETIMVNMQISKAKEYQQNCIDRIECSYYNNAVINDCISQSEKYGYRLVVENETIYADRPAYMVKLSYPVKIPLLGIDTNGIIQSYAR